MNEAKMIPIDAMVGSEVTRISTHSFYMFWLPRKADQQIKAEIGMDTAVRYNVGMRKDFAKVQPALLDRDIQTGGSWTEVRYNVIDGTCLKVWGEKASWGVVNGKAAVILLATKEAPVSRVILKLSGLPQCTKNEVHITGQFFVLNRDTMEEHPNLPTLTKQCEHFSSPVFINEVFKIEECIPAPEKAMAQKINAQSVDTGAIVKAGGSLAQGTVILKTRKGKRVMG